MLPLGSVTLGYRTPTTRGKSKATLEKDLEESKKKKSRQDFRLVDESHVEEVNLVSEEQGGARRRRRRKRRKSSSKKRK